MTDKEKQHVERDDTEKHDEETEKTNEEQSDSSADHKDEDEVAKLKDELKASNEARDKLYARLKRQESKDGDESDADKSDDKKDKAAPALSREEAIVIAKGHSEEELERAKKIAALEGIKVTEAIETDLFKDWKAKRDKEAKDRAAQLGVSKGGKPVVKKTLLSKGLSDDEHKELFNEKIGR